jgi:outer membrane biosynthesis protein TonB
MENYRCYCTRMWDTHRECIADTVTWFPQHVSSPIASSTNLVIAGAHNIIKALLHPSPGTALSATSHSLTKILLNREQSQAVIPNASSTTTPTPPAPVLRVPTPAVTNTTIYETAPQDDPAPPLRVAPPPEAPATTYAKASAPKKRRSRRLEKPTAKKLENDLHQHCTTLGNSPNEATSLLHHHKPG